MDSCGCSVSVQSDLNGIKPKFTSVDVACPTNGVVGKKVDRQTVKALLSLPLNVLGEGSYRFCADPDCPSVYYSENGQQVFTEDDLRERVYQKDPDDKESTICYCFKHTCDIRNPQGACCLGNVRAAVKRFSN